MSQTRRGRPRAARPRDAPIVRPIRLMTHRSPDCFPGWLAAMSLLHRALDIVAQGATDSISFATFVKFATNISQLVYVDCHAYLLMIRLKIETF
ncbi:hypothetical protein OO25_03980 [Phaeobacter sp. S60]|nr:hypothetical protein OO25_03980 [Phaeobacter sp. S60]